MKKKYLLREGFSAKLGKDVHLGPKELELDTNEFKAHQHKLELIGGDGDLMSNEDAQELVDSGEAEIPGDAVVDGDGVELEKGGKKKKGNRA
jgi:hypothetical protein